MWSRVATLLDSSLEWTGSHVHAVYARGRRTARPSRRILALQLGYAALLVGALLFTHSWPAPDVVAILLLAFALLAMRGFAFLRDWTPFIVLLLGYVALTGAVPGLETRTHVGFPIVVDRDLFGGHVPTVWLQSHFFHPGQLRWYDYGATLLYPMHFVAPLLLAFVLWMWRADLYWKFVASYLLLCYAGFITYLLYPMAPPWWAAQLGRIPAVQPILNQVQYGRVGNPVVLAERYFHTNPVAAMPSLHAAVPLLVFLVLQRLAPRWGWISAVYPLTMSLAVVYLGEHYVIDVLVGWLYALVAFAVVWNRPPHPRLPRLRRSARPSLAGAETPALSSLSLPARG